MQSRYRELAALERDGCKQLLDYFLHRKEFNYCIQHPLHSSCTRYLLWRWYIVAKGLLNLNIPIHVIPFLIFKLKTLRKEGPIKPILKLCFNIFRSVMFLTTFVGSILLMNELSHHFLKDRVSFYNRNCVIAFLATAGIACEQPHRRVDITYYVMPRSLEIIWEMLKNRRLVKDLPGQNTFLLALALGIIAYKFAEESIKDQENKRAGRKTNEHDKSIRGFSLHVCRSLWGHSALRVSEEQETSPKGGQDDMTTTQLSLSDCNDNFVSEVDKTEKRAPMPKKISISKLRTRDGVGPVEMIVKSSRSQSDDISLNLQ